MPLTDLRDVLFQDLVTLLATEGEAGFRATQIYRWLYARQVTDVHQMTNLPERLRPARSA